MTELDRAAGAIAHSRRLGDRQFSGVLAKQPSSETVRTETLSLRRPQRVFA
jgi:hypothetical protein